METLTLRRLLEIFNSPVNEEQAWAVCYQCAKYLQGLWRNSPSECHRFNGVNSVELSKDGLVAAILPTSERTTEALPTEYELVQSLGVVVFQALDWGLGETEEQRLSVSLEGLIERMTGSESDSEEIESRTNTLDIDGDEGIDAGDDASDIQPNKITLEEVIQVCSYHLATPGDAPQHYKAVCRALVTEAQELITFLDSISKEKAKLRLTIGIRGNRDERDGGSLEQLQRSDWARLWIQVMRDLRLGVQLKKVEHTDLHRSSVEYELTPYEILMEDIRTRRYTLRQVLVSTILPPVINGDIPLRTKKDAHEIILDFIRSRPPLHPVKDRKLNSPPPKSPDIREQLLESIRAEPKLRPTPGRYVVETSRTRLTETSGSPVATRKIIKPDLSLLMSNSFDEEDDDDDDLFGESFNHVSPQLMSPLSPLSPLNDSNIHGPSPWQQTVALDLASTMGSLDPDRRHSITVCESPNKMHAAEVAPPPGPQRHPSADYPLGLLGGVSVAGVMGGTNARNALECLSLTIEEVMHIRSVLTKAELECLVVDPQLQMLLAKGKVCFTCKKTKFSLFGQWATKCKFCRRNVCSKCCSKMRIPTEHFEHVPVYTLSPSPLSPTSTKGIFTYEKTGSVPNSPELPRKNVRQLPEHPTRSFISSRPPLQRAQTVARPPGGLRTSSTSNALQGPLMNVCKDCKTMIVNIIRSSRTQLAKAPETAKQKVQMPSLRRFHSFRTPRNFHLDLKPVYK